MGKIKQGQGTVIGNAGEFLVVGELLKRPPEYYVVPTSELNNRLKAIHEYWVNLPSKRGKHHNPNSRMRRIGFTQHHKVWLLEHRGAWHPIFADANHHA